MLSGITGRKASVGATENIEASQASRSSEILTNSVSVAATKALTSEIKANARTTVNSSNKSQAKAIKLNGSSKAAQLSGTKIKGPAPSVLPKPTNRGQVIGEGVVEEHISAGQAILKFESESATFTAVNSMVPSTTSSPFPDKAEEMVEPSPSGKKSCAFEFLLTNQCTKHV